MDLVGFANRRHARFGQTNAADFAGSNQFSHRAHGLLDGRVAVHAVLIIKIDAFHIEPF